MLKPIIRTLWWEKGRLYILDQRYLPERERIVELKSSSDVWKAIRNLSIRGAPAIGCVAAYGVALSALKASKKDREEFIKIIKGDIKRLKTSRPTAYNLFFALSRMEKVLTEFNDVSVSELKERLLKEAEKIYREDLTSCYKIGLNGADLIEDGMSILTHCNAGGLATSGYGT
ncbi:MAG: S-methyl-5-thioribose-1-phosphate isomerase, partial [Candidatus Omnitrophica bacterium]|nr:S-methyl-5-thioribose-1-phosphate isomerase [Candidatus Omnitrophota bacterium]